MQYLIAAVMFIVMTSIGPHISQAGVTEDLTKAAPAPAAPAAAAPAAAPAAVPGHKSWLDEDGGTVSFRGLIALFVLAILIESAFSVIFNWRLYLQFFDNRGMKTLVMIAVSAFLVFTFQINILEKILISYGIDVSPHDYAAKFVTSLILAGGSAGIYNILVAFGYRQARTPENFLPKPKPARAWISVRTTRRTAVGAIFVQITEENPVQSPLPEQLAGVVAAQDFWPTLKSVFVRDQSRFPQTGGHELKAATVYKLEIFGKDNDQNRVDSDINGLYHFADGAIIDFVATL